MRNSRQTVNRKPRTPSDSCIISTSPPTAVLLCVIHDGLLTWYIGCIGPRASGVRYQFLKTKCCRLGAQVRVANNTRRTVDRKPRAPSDY